MPECPPFEILPDGSSVNGGALSIGGCAVATLAHTFGTPLYIYDEKTLRGTAERVLQAFAPLGARVSFAAKSCATLEVLRVLLRAGLDLDVVSAGELQAGVQAGFNPASIHFHGNCKSADELEAAVRHGIHAIVVDNLEELDVLEQVCRKTESGAHVMLRVALRLEAETHAYLQTSGRGSKFGVLRGSADELRALHKIEQSTRLCLVGIHAHLGSQIAEPQVYRTAAEELTAFAATLRGDGPERFEVSIGGGWSVPYCPGDRELDPAEMAEAIAPSFRANPDCIPAVEPGRAIVARSAVALYRVGSVKRTGERRIIAVDGGMGDNPRPALYGARYTALVDGRVESEGSHGGQPLQRADVVGRYCESGDVLVRDVHLPEVKRDDLICVPVAGAYQLSMASAYNLVPPPAVVMVADERARLITRRGTTAELLAREV
jgi:diaminopimelate decarboxylase